MKIGIKFCGGCQSKFDRGDTYETLIKRIKNANFEYVEKNGIYDILVVISGCQIQCADTNYTAKEIVHIYNENYKQAVKIVEDVLLKLN